MPLQTAKATGDIAKQISGIQAASVSSVAAIKTIAATIYQISEIPSALTTAIEEQSLFDARSYYQARLATKP